MEQRTRADLHIHTTASDGTLTPEEAIREAAEAGLAAAAVADHDTVDGVTPAIAAGKSLGVLVVPAVEINTDYGTEEIHILGYYIDVDSPPLLAHLARLRECRLERGRRMVERLNRVGVKISIERVREIAGMGSLGRPHVAQALVEGGYARTLNGAFGKYLVRGAPGYVERYKLTAFQAVDIVRDAGGVAVFAHPGKSRSDQLIPDLVQAGLQGIEAFHPDHSPAQARRYRSIARKYGLVVTGGSDSHGPGMLKPVPVGCVTVDISVVHELEALAEEGRASAA